MNDNPYSARAKAWAKIMKTLEDVPHDQRVDLLRDVKAATEKAEKGKP